MFVILIRVNTSFIQIYRPARNQTVGIAALSGPSEGHSMLIIDGRAYTRQT